MDIKLHKQATTTPKIRAEIQAAPESETDQSLADQFGVSVSTIRRWRHRNDVYDRSHTRHDLKATLSAEQEQIVLHARSFLRLGLDDLLVVVREFICPDMSRSALHRMLQRHKVPSLRELAKAEQPESSHKPFKDYEPGYVHVDIKYLPQMPDEAQRRYLFVAIDRASRWVYMEVRPRQTAEDAESFLNHLLAKAPFKIRTMLTDNGKAFTDRFTSGGERKPTGRHKVDQLCQSNDIEHRLIRPGYPQTNGMVERFNGRIADVLRSKRYDSSEDLESTLKRYCYLYNQHINQKALKHQTPVQSLKDWQKKKPDLFIKKVVNHTGPDT